MPAAHHVFLSILVMTSPAPDVWPSILTDYTYDSELDIADGVPRNVSTQRLVPSGNHGYIRNLGRSLLVTRHGVQSVLCFYMGTDVCGEELQVRVNSNQGRVRAVFENVLYVCDIKME